MTSLMEELKSSLNGHLPVAIRWRETGELLCAAATEEQDGDRYLDDHVHYQLSVGSNAITVDDSHENSALWLWTNTTTALMAMFWILTTNPSFESRS